MIYSILLLILVICSFIISIVVVINKYRDLNNEIFKLQTEIRNIYSRLSLEEKISREHEHKLNTLENKQVILQPYQQNPPCYTEDDDVCTQHDYTNYEELE